MYNPTQIIKIDNKSLKEELQQRLIGWRYEDVETVDKLTLTFDNKDLKYTDDEIFQQGLIVDFRFGYIDDLTESKYFSISKIKGFTTITVECLEVITLFNTEPKYRLWEDSKLEDVVKEVATGNNLKYEVQERKDSTDSELKFTYVQPYIEDMAFLYTLAKHIGYEMWIEGDTLYFMPRKYWQSPYMEFTYLGLNGQILDFQPETHAMNIKGQFKAGGIDLSQNQTFFFTEKGDTKTTTYLASHMWDQKDMVKYYKQIENESLVRIPCSTKKEAESILAGKYITEMEDQITADLYLVGEPKLKSKRVITINNAGKYSGKYYVKSVTHSFDGNGFITIVKLSRNASFDDGEKYSRQTLDSLVNKNRLSKKEFLEETKMSPLVQYYRKLLNL